MVACSPAAGAERQQYKWPPWFPNKMKPMFEAKPGGAAGRAATPRRVGKLPPRDGAKPAASGAGKSKAATTPAVTDSPAGPLAATAAVPSRAAEEATTPVEAKGGTPQVPAAAEAPAPAVATSSPEPVEARLPRARPPESDAEVRSPPIVEALNPPQTGVRTTLGQSLSGTPAGLSLEIGPERSAQSPQPGWSDPRGSVGEILAVPADSPFAAAQIAASDGRLETADREATSGEDPEAAVRRASGGDVLDSDGKAANAADAIDALARLPRARPGAGNGPELAMATVGQPPDLPSTTDVPSLAPAVPDGDEAACRARLDAMGVSYKPMPPLDPGGPCEVAQPLAVTAVGSGVRLSSTATLNCRTAAALATWVRESVVPTARRTLNATPTVIAPGSTYACRPRNNQAGAKLSEHGHANAFDVMSIAFAEREPVDVKAWPDDSAEGRFDTAIRAASCRYFTTVLGPGDAAHSNHFHLDMAVRRGGYRLCSLEAGQKVAGRASAPAGAKTNSE